MPKGFRYAYTVSAMIALGPGRPTHGISTLYSCPIAACNNRKTAASLSCQIPRQRLKWASVLARHIACATSQDPWSSAPSRSVELPLKLPVCEIVRSASEKLPELDHPLNVCHSTIVRAAIHQTLRTVKASRWTEDHGKERQEGEDSRAEGSSGRKANQKSGTEREEGEV